jgi:hypothetical protein
MPFVGNGFLALWNDHAAEQGQYDVWHTREHVIERLGVPGFRFARRYAGGEGQLPGYFTLYGLDDVGVLESRNYRRLLANPTPWSKEMRPGMRDFLRHGCTLTATLGGGVGGLLAAGLFRLSMDDADAAALLAEVAPLPPFTAMHLGRIEHSVSGVLLGGPPPEIGADADAALLVEGYEPHTFRPAVASLADRLDAAGFCHGTPHFTIYTLAFSLGAAELGQMLPLPAQVT